jgi:hypothetical protein
MVGGLILMKYSLLIGTVAILSCLVLSAQTKSDLNFSGTWILDKDRSFSNPAGLEQTTVITHNGETLKFDAKVKTAQGEQAIQETWTLDGQEREFTPDGAKPGSKGMRMAYWLPGRRAIVLVDERTTPGEKGPVTQRTTRKFGLSSDGKTLTVDYFSDTPRYQVEAKRVFVKQ